MLYHHDPDACPTTGSGAVTLVHLVHAADAYVRSVGLETLRSEIRPPESPGAAFEAIGLGGRLPELPERFQSQFESIRGIFA